MQGTVEILYRSKEERVVRTVQGQCVDAIGGRLVAAKEERIVDWLKRKDGVMEGEYAGDDSKGKVVLAVVRATVGCMIGRTSDSIILAD